MKKQLLLIIGIFLFGINSSFSYCRLPGEDLYTSGERVLYAGTFGGGGGFFLGGMSLLYVESISTAATVALWGGSTLGLGLAAVAGERTVSLIRTIRKNRKFASERMAQWKKNGIDDEFKASFEKFKKRHKKIKGIDELRVSEFALAIAMLGEKDELCNKRGLYLDKNKIFKKLATLIDTKEFREILAKIRLGDFYKENDSFMPRKFIDPNSSKCYQKDGEELIEIKDLEGKCLGPQIIANRTKSGYYCGDVRFEEDKNGNRKMHIRAINTSSSISSDIHRVCRGVIEDEERSIKSSCNHLKLRLQIKHDNKNAEIDKQSEKFQTCLHIEGRDRSDAQAAFNLCKDTEFKELKRGSAKEEMGALYDELKSDLELKNLMTSYESDKQLLSAIREIIQGKLVGRDKAIIFGDNLRIELDEFSNEGELIFTHTIYFDSSNNLKLDSDPKYASQCEYLGKDETPKEICSSKHPQESKVSFDTFVMNNINEGCVETKYEYIKRFTVSSNEKKKIASKNRKNANKGKASKR